VRRVLQQIAGYVTALELRSDSLNPMHSTLHVAPACHVAVTVAVLITLLMIYVIHSVSRGVVGQGRGGTASPHFFRQGGRVPHFFGLKFVQKLVHCCNWLLNKMQCQIISVQQNCYSM